MPIQIESNLLRSFDHVRSVKLNYTDKAPRNVCYREALNAACERRGIDMSRIEVFDGFSQSLPIHTTETSSLGGKYLRVTGEYANGHHGGIIAGLFLSASLKIIE